jgi:hypothetical protein
MICLLMICIALHIHLRIVLSRSPARNDNIEKDLNGLVYNRSRLDLYEDVKENNRREHSAI